jgi:hypothetical protein
MRVNFFVEERRMNSQLENRVGRPAELDAVKLAEICALIASGCSYRTAAKYVGCTAAAISMRVKRDPEFAEQLDKAVAQREAILLSHLRESSKKSWRAAAFLLQITVGGRFGGHVPTLEEEAESERLEGALAIACEPVEPKETPPPRIQDSQSKHEPPKIEHAPTKPKTTAVAKQSSSQQESVSAMATARGKQRNTANAIGEFMDALDQHWERQDALDDERFFDPSYDDT